MTIFVVGIIGILLIFISDIFDDDNQNKVDTNQINHLSENEYCSLIEDKISKIIKSMTGNDNSKVIVTLDSSYEYVYLNENSNDSKVFFNWLFY